MHVKYRQDNLHRMTWYTGSCGIMALGLWPLWSNVCVNGHYDKMCVLYGPWMQWFFMAGAASMGGHYRTDIIIVVGHSRSDSVVLLVLCMIMCNG